MQRYQLWGAVRTYRVKRALQEPGDPNSPSSEHAAISGRIPGNHSSFSPSAALGQGQQHSCRTGARLQQEQDALVPQFVTGRPEQCRGTGRAPH